MVLLIFINSLIILNSYFIARLFFYSRSLPDFIISCFIIFYAQIILILQTLGVLGKLYSNNIVILCLLFFVVNFTAWRLFSQKKQEFPKWQILEYLSEINKIERLALSAIIGFTVIKLAINLFNPPFGWDSLNYHFGFPVEWLKSGNLKCPISVNGDPSVSYYPINGSLFYFWFIFPLKNVFLADLGQFPFFIFAFLGVYSIARKLNISARYSLLSASLFSVIPNYFKQLQIAYVDIMDAALFIISLNFLFVAHERKALRYVFLSVLSAALLLGTKITAMPLALLLFVGVILVASFSFRKRLLSILIISGSILVIFGGFSYLRNIFTTGNPLYPLNLRIFDITIFKGVIDNAIYRIGIFPGDFGLRRLLFSEGLGAQTLLLIFPVVLLSPFLPFIKINKSDKPNYLVRFLFILPILVVLIFRFILPLPNIRYIYCIFAVSMIIAFYLLEKLFVPRNVVLWVVFICIMFSIGELAKHIELVISLIFSAFIYLIFPYSIKFLHKFSFREFLVSLFVFLISLMFSEQYYIKNEFSRYFTMVKYSGFWPDAAKSWYWLNEHTIGNNIAYTGTPVPFPLYGERFKNNVRYVSVNTVEPAMLHYYPKSNYVWGYKDKLWVGNFEEKNNFRGSQNYYVWLENMHKNKIDFLYVYAGLHLSGEFPIEDKWALAHPEIFQCVFTNAKIHIYKLK